MPSSGIAASALALPAAARLQEIVTADDAILRSTAMIYRPGVRWWWGVRRSGIDNYAYCYLCGRPISHWSGRNRMTRIAVAAVQGHREAHIEHGLSID